VPPIHDPRYSPLPGDRVLLASEGTARAVLLVDPNEGVTWRFLGGTVRRVASLEKWRLEVTMAKVVARGP
jgi:hypothetical protein